MPKKVSKIKCICKECGKIFYKYPSRIRLGEGKFCSKQCFSNYLKSKTIIKQCIICNRTFKTWQSHIIKGKYKCCSKKCADEYKRKYAYKTKQWKGGKFINKDRYVCVKYHNHPNSDCQNYVMEHRLVIEKILNRFLPTEYPIHHINGVRTNNRPENLICFTSKSAHNRFHKSENNVSKKEIIFDGRKYRQKSKIPELGIPPRSSTCSI